MLVFLNLEAPGSYPAPCATATQASACRPAQLAVEGKENRWNDGEGLSKATGRSNRKWLLAGTDIGAQTGHKGNEYSGYGKSGIS